MYPQTCTQKAHAVRPTSIILQNCSLCSSHCAATPTFLERQLPLLPHIDFQGTPRPPSNVSPNEVLERSIREHCRQCLHIWSAGVNPKDAKKNFATICTFLFANPKNANNRILKRLVRCFCLRTQKHAIFRILQRLFPFFLRTQLLGSPKKKTNNRCKIRKIAYFGFANKKIVPIVAKFSC